ncbi:MAG TPA: hypothetical protein VNP73_00755, partial [Actinomycetota bacterium]|nr:hypothetical protein [Actinomycetota bacterium]
PVIALGYAFTFILGYASALGVRVLGRPQLVAAAAASLVAEIAVIAATWDRYRFVGTRSQWSAGDAYPLFGVSPEGPVRLISVLGPIFAVALAAGVWIAWRGSRAAAADR